VRRETGKEYKVRFHDDEGLANHIDLKPCVDAREGIREASVEDGAQRPNGARVVVGGTQEASALVGGEVLARAVVKQFSRHPFPPSRKKGDRGRVARVLSCVIRARGDHLPLKKSRFRLAC
jgi:hypothetical protein